MVGVIGEKSFLVMFQYSFNKDTSLNQITVVIVDRTPNTKEADVPTISSIPVVIVGFNKGLYQ